MNFMLRDTFALFSRIDWFVLCIWLDISTLMQRLYELVYSFSKVSFHFQNKHRHKWARHTFWCISKLRHFILKFNLLNYCSRHCYLSQHFIVLNFADRVCLCIPYIIGYSVDVVLKSRHGLLFVMGNWCILCKVGNEFQNIM